MAASSIARLQNVAPRTAHPLVSPYTHCDGVLRLELELIVYAPFLTEDQGKPTRGQPATQTCMNMSNQANTHVGTAAFTSRLHFACARAGSAIRVDSRHKRAGTRIGRPLVVAPADVKLTSGTRAWSRGNALRAPQQIARG